MRVKRLEIQGFKSFKDKTVIHFDDGVTGIVGPNGCGKSNIVDAFFWVMGEQSVKHMRADGQLDLIFNGSEKYSPLGMAEVTLILTTGASASTIPDGASVRDLPPHLRYEEISVTRRLYRDGESEFFINGQLCRLKDIHELFMDTGAGPKAYSIIEQGAISKIVASKPEDRRTIIEEAAGITKFKARKKESLRKIEATQQNLLRINDIVSEIERQLASLERQASKARQYKKYREELQSKELLVGRKKLFVLQNNVNNARDRVQELEGTEAETRAALQTAELQIETLKLQLTEAQQAAEDLQNSLQMLQREISQTDTRVQLHKRQIHELENSNQTLDEENSELTERIERLSAEKLVLEEESAKLSDLFANADGILKEHQSRLDEAKAKSDELGRAVEQKKRELMSKLNRQTEISNQVHGFEARVDSLSVQINTITDRVKDRELEAEILLEKLETARSLHENSSGEMAIASEQASALKSEIVTLDEELRSVRAQEASASQEAAKTESRHKALQQLVDSYEGLQSNVKNILKESDLSAALDGILADKVEAHPGFEYALETVLRDYLENFFVKNSTEAAALLGSLKERNLGRASF
jgi:chromosome segregation protein